MAPTKFDRDIKQELEKRNIRPSGQAWGRLSERLDAEGKNESNKTYWWLGIAASVVGILFIAIQFFNNNDSKNISPQVVDAPEIIEEQVILDGTSKEIIQETLEVKREVATTKKETINNGDLPIEKNIISTELKSTLVVNKEPVLEKQDVELNLIKALEETLTFEKQKIQEVVAQVQELKENKNHVTEAEIEALLQQAQQEIALKKLYDDNAGIVDASALLQEVEDDLDQSFRTKVFEALKESYGAVKTAVASRND